jgi:acyl carrier protein
MNEFILKLEDLFEMQSGSILPNDLFRDYESWNSFALLSLMAMLEDEYGKTIPREVFEKLNTIEDLHNYIISK